jgi:hypothetical protein
VCPGKSFANAPRPSARRLPRFWRWSATGKGREAGLKQHASCPQALASPDIFSPAAIAFVTLQIQTEILPLAPERLTMPAVLAAAPDLIDRYCEKGDYPPSFYQLFRVTQQEWALAKGEDTFDGVTYTARRGMWYEDEAGKRVELFAGDLVEADDVSIDCPYYVQLPDGSYSVGRQVLCFREPLVRNGSVPTP